MRYSPSLNLASVLASDLGGAAVPVGGQGAGLAYCRCARVVADGYGLFIRRTSKGLDVSVYPLGASPPDIAWPEVSVSTGQSLAAQVAAVRGLLDECLPLDAWRAREAEAKAEAKARVAPLLEAMEAARLAALAGVNSHADD